MVGLSFRSDSKRYPQQMILCRADSNLDKISIIIFYQGSKCPSLPGLTHWANPGLPGLGFKPYFGKVGNTGE